MSLLFFLAIFVNMLSIFLLTRHKSRYGRFEWIMGSVVLLTMLGLTYNYYVSEHPILFNYPGLLWELIGLGILIELISLVKKSIPGQIVAASLHLFLVVPTIFSIGSILLIMAIIEIAGALFFLLKTDQPRRNEV